MVEWYLFLPQVRLSVADITERACHAEASGFDGIAFIDHLEAPGLARRKHLGGNGHCHLGGGQDRAAADRPSGALRRVSASGRARQTGRHPVGGIGGPIRARPRCGSWPAEFTRFDVGQQDPVARVEQLERHLALITQYWGDGTGEVASQVPRREHQIPLILGGTGRRMMELVRSYADWWNLPANHLDRLPELAPKAGTARLSIQQMVGFVRSGSDPDKVREVSTRRFGNLGSGLVCGDADAPGPALRGPGRPAGGALLHCSADFAAPDSLHEFGETVIKAFPGAGVPR